MIENMGHIGNMRNKDRTWAEIDLAAIRHNVQAMRAVLPETTRFLGVVKADAYGHGAYPVALNAVRAGASYLAVATLAEAAELKPAFKDTPVLILGMTPPERAGELQRLGVVQTVGSLKYARELSERLDGPLAVHMKLDTGMSRTGFDAVRPENFGDIAQALKLKNLRYEGVFTHFAVSDEPESDFTVLQFRRFMETVEKAENVLGRPFPLRHAANSGAVVNFRHTALDMVRPGISLYGLYPGRDRGGIDLKPALSLKSRVAAVTKHFPPDTVSYGRTAAVEKPSRLAVLPIGYADGYPRIMSNKAEVLLHGRRCRQIGRICMDMCMVDVSELPDVREGDVATLIGADGDGYISADELAEWAGTISYEIFCGISPRVPRFYLNDLTETEYPT